jgi:multidrug efflux system membrane fusion protein
MDMMARKGFGGEAAPVVVVAARKGNLPVYLTGLGTVTAYYTVTLHSRVDGEIMQVYFKEGQFVNKGDALLEIDPRPYQVMLEQAEGQLAKDQATLKDAELDFNRYTVLVNEGVIARQQLDTQTATMDSTKGAIKTDQAAIDTAKLDLAYCHITAPISGRIGLRLVDPGNIAHAADTNGLVVITQLQPIAVIFTLPQDQLPEVYKELHAMNRLPVDAFDRDDVTKITTGYLQTMDNQIDTTTGTYKLKAVFDNDKNELFPNQFVNIHLLVNTQKNVTIIPATAVQRGPDGTYVYVVNGGDTVKVRSVKVGMTQGNNISIASGLKPGEEVVTDGLDKLTDGSKIEARSAPVSEVTPEDASANPTAPTAAPTADSSSTPSPAAVGHDGVKSSSGEGGRQR